jgi:ATP-dependent Clp protease ATP-binding subunit ClpB
MTPEKPFILILCTGNSCRSHMAESILRVAAGDLLDVHSAGSKPAGYVHPLAIKAMAEIGIDISKYMEPISVNRLIGAPPGYVGYEEGGQLTEAVRRKPYAVILFDEIEKAHHDVFNALLQVLDDGRLTDGQGRTVDFKNTVIIMTSNIGSRHLLEGVTGDSIPEAVRESVMADLRKSFRPEFLNRIDETILFKPLTLEEITTIVDLLLVDLNKRLADRRVTVKLDKRAKDWAAEKGYDPVFGARPLKRFLQRNIETKLARALLTGEVGEGTTVTFHVRGDELVLEGAPVQVM